MLEIKVDGYPHGFFLRACAGWLCSNVGLAACTDRILCCNKPCTCVPQVLRSLLPSAMVLLSHHLGMGMSQNCRGRNGPQEIKSFPPEVLPYYICCLHHLLIHAQKSFCCFFFLPCGSGECL